MTTARELLEDAVHCIYLGTEHGRRTHAAIVEHLRADEPRVAEGLTTLVESIDYCHKTRHLRHSDNPRHLAPVDCYCSVNAALEDARAILASLPAPRPPEPDRTAALAAQGQWMSSEEFQSSGLLWHVNQAILWPLGLALAVTADRDAEPHIWDASIRVMRRDPFEAICSGATEEETRAQADRLEAWMRARFTPTPPTEAAK